MTDELFEKMDKEIAIITGLVGRARNLSHITTIIAATARRYDNHGVFSTRSELTKAYERIHYAIYHLGTVAYYESAGIKEFRGLTPDKFTNEAENKFDYGVAPGRPLHDLLDTWNRAVSNTKIFLNYIQKRVKNPKSVDAMNHFLRTCASVTEHITNATRYAV